VDVRLSPDVSIATIYVSILGKQADEAEPTMKVLNDAAGYFRTELGRRMKLRTVPQLRFFYDRVEEEGRKIDALLKIAAETAIPDLPEDDVAQPMPSAS
jgi:ribosome-binding factor A